MMEKIDIFEIENEIKKYKLSEVENSEEYNEYDHYAVHFEEYWRLKTSQFFGIDIDITHKAKVSKMYWNEFYKSATLAPFSYVTAMDLPLSICIKYYDSDADPSHTCCMYGRVDILDWAKKNSKKLFSAYNGSMNGNWAINAKKSHINVLEWMKSNGIPLTDVEGANSAARYGHLHILEWIKNNRLPLPNIDGVNSAAQNGHLHILEWIKSNRLPLPDSRCLYWVVNREYYAIIEWMITGNLVNYNDVLVIILSFPIQRTNMIKWFMNLRVT